MEIDKLDLCSEARDCYNEIMAIISKYRPADLDSEYLCHNYYNDDSVIPLLKKLIGSLKDDNYKLDNTLAILAPYLIELLSPGLIIKIDKRYFNSEGAFHTAITNRIRLLCDNINTILKGYVSVCTVYHFDRLIHLSKHFNPDLTYFIASRLSFITANNRDYDDLVLAFSYEAIIATTEYDREYERLVHIFTRYLFSLDDLDIIKRSIDWLAKFNKSPRGEFYIGLAYFRYYLITEKCRNLDKLTVIDSKLHSHFINVRDMAHSSNLYMIYLYNRCKMAIMLNDLDMMFNIYQCSYLICEKYLNEENLSIHVDIINLIFDYNKAKLPYLDNISNKNITLDTHIRGSIKAEINADFYVGDIDLLFDGEKGVLRVVDYFQDYHHKYVFMSLSYNSMVFAPVLFEAITDNGNITFKYITDKKILIEAHDNVMRDGH